MERMFNLQEKCDRIYTIQLQNGKGEVNLPANIKGGFDVFYRFKSAKNSPKKNW